MADDFTEAEWINHIRNGTLPTPRNPAGTAGGMPGPASEGGGVVGSPAPLSLPRRLANLYDPINPLSPQRLSEDPEKKKLQLEGMSPSGVLTNPLRAAEKLGWISKGVAPPADAPEGVAQVAPEVYAPEGSPLTPKDGGVGGVGGAGAARQDVIDHPKSVNETRELGHDVTEARSHYNLAAVALHKAADLEQKAVQQQSEQEAVFFDGQLRNKQNLQNIQAGRELERQNEIQSFQAKVQAARDHAQDPAVVLGNGVGELLAGLGVALGAWSATRSKGPNHALALYNAMAEKKVQQLRQESQDTENFFSRMKAQFGDERQAELATRLTMDDIAKTQLARIGAASKSEFAKAAVQKQIASIEAQQGGTALDLQKSEDGKRVQSVTTNQPYRLTENGAKPLPMLPDGTAAAPVAPSEQSDGAVPPAGVPASSGTAAPARKSLPSVGELVDKEHPWLVDDKALSALAAEAKRGKVADSGPAVATKVGGTTVLVRSPGALVAKPEEASKGAVGPSREPLRGEALLRWRVQNDPWKTKDGDTNDPQEKGKLSYHDWLKIEKNPALQDYIVQAPKVIQALESTRISDMKWRAYLLADRQGAGSVFLAALPEEEKQDINRIVAAHATFLAIQGGKALNKLEGANLGRMYGGTGSLSAMKQTVRDAYNQKAAEWNASVGGLRRTGLLTLYDNARHGGPPVWAQPWDSQHVPAGKAK